MCVQRLLWSCGTFVDTIVIVVSPISVFRFSCSCRGKTMGVWVFGLMLLMLVVEECRARRALSVLDGRFNFWPNNAGVCGVLGVRWNTRYKARCGIDRFRIRTVRAPGWTRYLWNHLGGNGKGIEVFGKVRRRDHRTQLSSSIISHESLQLMALMLTVYCPDTGKVNTYVPSKIVP